MTHMNRNVTQGCVNQRPLNPYTPRLQKSFGLFHAVFNVVQDLLIRHTLDVMHCEKNLCENIIKTLFGETDYPRGRLDLKDMGIRPDLWLRPA